MLGTKIRYIYKKFIKFKKYGRIHGGIVYELRDKVEGGPNETEEDVVNNQLMLLC